MADIMEAAPSNTCSPVTIRREEYINQFRVAFLDECGRSTDWRFQVGEPVWYSSGTGLCGYTFVSSVSKAGFFTVNSDPTTKHEVAYAQKYRPHSRMFNCLASVSVCLG